MESLNLQPKTEMEQYEKDECKIIINDYLMNGDTAKKLNVKNVKQLYYIVDFLLEYILTKEKSFKDKIQDVTNQSLLDYEEKFKNMTSIIEKNNLSHLFKDILDKHSGSQSINSSLYVKSKPLVSRPGSAMK
jgi:hypothetical protein